MLESHAPSTPTAAPTWAPLARCHCVTRSVMAYRDEDGDWSCAACGRLVMYEETDRSGGFPRTRAL